jgi:hypothetical protein
MFQPGHMALRQGAGPRSEEEIARRVTISSANHLLKCSMVIPGKTVTHYMKCYLMKDMPDGRKKVVVFGTMYDGEQGQKKRVRYVPADRVTILDDEGPYVRNTHTT